MKLRMKSGLLGRFFANEQIRPEAQDRGQIILPAAAAGVSVG